MSSFWHPESCTSAEIPVAGGRAGRRGGVWRVEQQTGCRMDSDLCPGSPKKSFFDISCTAGQQCCAENGKKGGWNIKYLSLTCWSKQFLAVKFVSTFKSVSKRRFFHFLWTRNQSLQSKTTTRRLRLRVKSDALSVQTQIFWPRTQLKTFGTRCLRHNYYLKHPDGTNILQIWEASLTSWTTYAVQSTVVDLTRSG